MKRVANIIFIILSIALAITIFIFSSDTGEESGSKSSSITEIILSIFIRDFHSISQEERLGLINNYSFLIRKLAHFTEYAALGFLLYGDFYTSNSSFANKKKVVVCASWLLAIIYAAIDELHQKFVAGRGPSIRDVMIDSMGALFGIMVFMLIILMIEKIKNKKK